MAGPPGRATHGHQLCGMQSQLGVALEGMDHPELHPVWKAMGSQCAKRHPLARLTMGHQGTRPPGQGWCGKRGFICMVLPHVQHLVLHAMFSMCLSCLMVSTQCFMQLCPCLHCHVVCSVFHAACKHLVFHVMLPKCLHCVFAVSTKCFMTWPA